MPYGFNFPISIWQLFSKLHCSWRLINFTLIILRCCSKYSISKNIFSSSLEKGATLRSQHMVGLAWDRDTPSYPKVDLGCDLILITVRFRPGHIVTTLWGRKAGLHGTYICKGRGEGVAPTHFYFSLKTPHFCVRREECGFLEVK